MSGIMGRVITLSKQNSVNSVAANSSRLHSYSTLYPVTVETLRFYRVRVLDAYPHLKHAIFTRQGGVSRQAFGSLNLSTSVGDNPQAVQSNYHRACQAVGVSPEQTVSCHLVHGADVLTIDKAEQRQIAGRADGLITNRPNVYLFMRFGDCTPLLFFDPIENGVGLTHAGWRGTMQNAAGSTVNAMVEQFGCKPHNIIAVIGPAIGVCCYEVGPDVVAAAATAFPRPESLFSRQNGSTTPVHFDLWAANEQQLLAAGVKQIIHSNICTACRTDEFFSHRAEKGQTGRFGVIIGLERSTA